MSKKHSLRRSAAGILAVLTVTGNLLAPAQFGITPIAQNAIVAEAATINQSGRWNYSGIAWDASTGTLTIKNGITNKEGAVNHDVDDEITGNLYCSFTKKIQYSAVKNIVFADGMTLPKSCQQLLKNFVNLETFRIEGEIDASNVYNLESMFEGLDKLTSVSFTGLKNTGTIDYIDNMFAGCEQLKVIDLSMLGGENVGMRDWGDGHGGYHPAVDHIRRAVAGCTALEDLNLTGEFLYNLWENIKEKQGIDSIDRILNEMLADLDSPHKQEIFDRLKQRFHDLPAVQPVQAAERRICFHVFPHRAPVACRRPGSQPVRTVDLRQDLRQ